uniref:Uncharacterized protein n=1 Tax=Micrurus corallinus TaxID=54390 RepID=A0A2D4FRN7_MICCO
MEPSAPLLFLKRLFIRELFFLKKTTTQIRARKRPYTIVQLHGNGLISYVTQEAVTTQAPFVFLPMCALLLGSWAVDFTEMKLAKYQPNRLSYGCIFSTG